MSDSDTTSTSSTMSMILGIGLAISVAANVYLGYQVSQTSTLDSGIPGNPKQIVNDLTRLQNDLGAQAPCSKLFTKTDLPEIERRKANLLVKIKADLKRKDHFALLCVNDIISMLLENADPAIGYNNQIVVYPEWNDKVSATHDSIGIFCIGANGVINSLLIFL